MIETKVKELAPDPNQTQTSDVLEGKVIGLVAPKSHPPGLTQAFAAALINRGHVVKIVQDEELSITECNIVILVGSVGSLRKTTSILRSALESRPFVVVWGNEPLPPIGMKLWALKLGLALSLTAVHATKSKPIWHILNYPFYLAISRFGLGTYSRAGRADRVFASFARFAFDNLGLIVVGIRENWIDLVCVTTKQRHYLLKELGMDPVFMSVGQQKDFGRDLGVPRDTDVLFIGRIKKNKDRARRMKQMISKIRAKGYTVEVHTKGLYGNRRTEVLNRTRIILNIHKFSWDTPWMRWFLADANGALVVSEALSVPEPLIPGEHFLSGKLEELPELIEKVLNDETRRLKMVKSCRKRINETMTLELSVDRLLASLRVRLREDQIDV